MEGVEINIPPALAELFGSIFRAILFFLVVALLFTLFGLTRDQGGLAATVAVILFVLAILALNFYDPRVVNEGWRLYLIFTITNEGRSYPVKFVTNGALAGLRGYACQALRNVSTFPFAGQIAPKI